MSLYLEVNFTHSLHITQYTINNKINSCTLGQV